MICLFILYCVYNRQLAPGNDSISLSIIVRDRPALLASWDLTVGGSCWWSPASMTFRERRIGTQQLAYKACAASSKTSKSNPPILSANCLSILSPADILVDKITLLDWNTSSAARPRLPFKSLRNALISRRISKACVLEAFLRSLFRLKMLFSISLDTSYSSEFLIRLSNEKCAMDLRNLAGWPSRQILSPVFDSF